MSFFTTSNYISQNKKDEMSDEQQNMADMIIDYKMWFETPEGNTNTAVGGRVILEKTLKRTFLAEDYTVHGRRQRTLRFRSNREILGTLRKCKLLNCDPVPLSLLPFSPGKHRGCTLKEETTTSSSIQPKIQGLQVSLSNQKVITNSHIMAHENVTPHRI